MKHILFMIVSVGTLTILSLSSCTKEEPSRFVIASSYPSTPSPANFELVAENWVRYGEQIYVNTFKDVIKSANASGNRTVTVYLQENGKQTQISQRYITYMGNELWATNSQSDVSIVYRCSTQLPFKSLNIRVQVN